MTHSIDKSQRNSTLVTLAFLIVMGIVFVVVIGILPYQNQSPLTPNGTPTPTLDPNQQFQFGITAFFTGDYSAAIENFTQAIEAQYSPLEDVKYRRALAYYSYSIQKQDEISADNAITDLKEALELDPNYLEAYRALGWAYYQKASFYQAEDQTPYFQQALETFQKGLELNKKFGQTDSQIYNGLGWVNYQLGNYQEAIDHFKLALNYNPDLIDAQRGLNLAKAELEK